MLAGAMDSGQPSGASSPTGSPEADTIIERAGEAADGGRDDPDDALSPGTRLGRYVVLEEIGTGGMGMVFSAYDPELNRKVALKLLRPRHREKKRNKTRNRLLREAQALAKLAHPNVITVYDVGTFGDRVFVAMELVEGDTLKGWMQTSKRRWDEVLRVFIPAGRGLAAAHAANLVHRDFKPDNVLIGRDDRVRVMDFGLARPMHGDTRGSQSLDPEPEPEPEEDVEEPAEPGSEGTDVEDALMTQTGSIMGTPAYMAPEQHMGKPTDARSDQFSFCIALYQALYGVRPFEGDDRGSLARQKMNQEIGDPPAGSSVPGWVRRHVLRGLSPRPEDRFASMDELLDELGKDPRVKRRKVLTGVGFVASMAGLVFTFQYYKNRRPKVCQDSENALAAVWNEGRAAEVGAAMESIGAPHVARTWTAAASAIDDYGTAWVAMHREACEATYLRGEQSARLLELRNNCLQERIDEIDAWADILAELPEGEALGVASRGAHAAYAISPLSSCADSEALAAAVDPPKGDEAKATVAELRRSLARVKVLGTLGLYDEALALAERSYESAGTLEYPPVVAEARYRLGQAQGLRGDGEQAEENLQEAAWLGASVKHDAIAAAAASELVHMIGRRMGQHDEGLSWARHAEAAIKRIGLGGYHEARLRHDIGVIRDATGDLSQAEADLTHAIELYATVPATALASIDARRCLADVRLHQGKLEEAAVPRLRDSDGLQHSSHRRWRCCETLMHHQCTGGSAPSQRRR
jgi:eukaryotic-like serine/threonine-protein kinase